MLTARRSLLWLNLVALAGYGLLAYACLTLRHAEALVPGIWLPAGWMVALAIEAGLAVLPGLWLGATLVDALTVDGPLWQHGLIGAAICLLPLTVALLEPRSIHRPEPLSRLRNVAGCLAAAFLGLVLSVGVGSGLRSAGSDLPETFLLRLLGVVALAPFLLTLAAAWRRPAGIRSLLADLRRPDLWLLALALTASGLVLQRGGIPVLSLTPFAFTFPLLLLAAFRLPTTAVTALMLATALLHSWLPNAASPLLLLLHPTDLTSRMLSGRLLAGMLLMVLLVVVANQEQRRLREQLERQKDHLEQIVAERTRELTLANARLEGLSLQDSLTGIANRRCFQGTLQAEWRRAQRQGLPLTVGLLDVDRFKAYNDHYGHPAGDRCLAGIAAALAEVMQRRGGMVARYGGEEFVVVLVGLDPQAVATFGEELRCCVSGLALPHASAGLERIVTLSVGLATAIPAAGMAAEGLVAAADAQLYAAKSGGRNRVCQQLPQRSL